MLRRLKYARPLLLFAAAGCGARTDLGSPVEPERAGRIEGERFASPCNAALLEGAAAPMLGICSTRTYRSRFAAPDAPDGSAALPTKPSRLPIAIDGHGRSYVVLDTEPSPAASIPGALAALEEDGTLAWRREVDGYLAGVPILGRDGSITLFATLSGGQRALVDFSEQGEITHTTELPLQAHANPAVASDGTLYVPLHEGSEAGVLAIAPDRTVRWEFTTPSAGMTDVAVDHAGRVWFAAGGDVVALRPDGSEELRHFVGPVVAGPSIGDDGSVHVATQKHAPESANAVVVLEPDGATRFATPLPETTQPDVPLAIAADGTTYVFTLYRLTAVGPDGAIRWSRDIDDGPGDAPNGCTIDVHGTVLVVAADLLALDPRDGAERWRIVATEPSFKPCYEVPTVGPHRRVYFADCNGPLRVATE